MGIITRVNKDGSLSHYVRYWDKGKEIRKVVGSSKRKAELVLAKRKSELHDRRLGITFERKPLPFTDTFQTWLDTYVRVYCKASTAAGYETAFRRYWKPAFGHTDMHDIDRAAVKSQVYTLLTTLTLSAVQNYIAPLSGLFNQLIEDGLLQHNPCHRVLRIPRKEQEAHHKKVDFLSREELAQLLKTCRVHFAAHYPLILTFARAGLRVGEAVALEWTDLDLQRRFIHVQRNWVDGVLTTPKSGKARRLDMSRQLMRTYRQHLTARKKETLRNGWSEVPPLVFLNPDGHRLDPDNFRKRVWPRILQKAGLRRIRLHDLRHTFASLLLQQGESLVYVKDQMGHHSIRVTADYYGHLIPGGNKAAVDRLDDPPARAGRRRTSDRQTGRVTSHPRPEKGVKGPVRTNRGQPKDQEATPAERTLEVAS